MSLLDAILGAQGGAIVQQLGSQVGLEPDQTAAALSALVPALAAGVHKNIQSDGGLTGLTTALAAGDHQKYIDDPTTIGAHTTIADGDAILGHVFGSKDVSRQVAGHASAATGIGVDVLKKLLPMAATLVMGALASRASNASTMASQTGGASLPGGINLSSILSATLGQASAHTPRGAGDVVGMLGRLLR